MGSTGDGGPLTQTARALQADNSQFQRDVTEACLQASGNPRAAVDALTRCLAQADDLERRELDFLGMMGEFGAQQRPRAQQGWRANRLQILSGKAQAHFLLGEYDAAQGAIDAARVFVSDPGDAAAGMLDQLEVAIIQMKG